MKFDITKLLGSKCRAKVMEKFFLSYSAGDGSGYHMRGLSRELDEQINSVKREIDNLETMGMLKYRKEARKKIFYINPSFPLIEEFEQIFIKTFDPLPELKKYLKSLPLVELAVIHNSIKHKLTTDTKVSLDIFIIGEIERSEFIEYLERIFYGRKIKYAVIATQDFFDRIEYGDKLMDKILNEPGNIFVKDALNIKERFLKK